jgi:hypothetical protein
VGNCGELWFYCLALSLSPKVPVSNASALDESALNEHAVKTGNNNKKCFSVESTISL